jgi:signal transduction histidine kinase
MQEFAFSWAQYILGTMIKKIIQYLAVYSNGILILLIVFSFLGLISITAKARRETISKIIQLDAVLVLDDIEPAGWQQVRSILDGSYAGVAGRELALAAAGYELALERFAGQNQSPGQARTELKQNLGRIILAYTDLLRRREAAFDSLYSFLVVGIFIQSFALMITLGRVGTTREEILRRDTMLALVQKVREDERHSLASYLHDSILQDLGSLGLHPTLRDAPEALGLLKDNIDKLRKVSYGLAPLHLDLSGLADSLRDLIAEHIRHGGIEVNFAELGYDDSVVDSETRLILYRGVQEGLANIRKYAAATKAELRLVISQPYLILTLRDNGRGFDPKAVRLASGCTASGLGLALLARQVQGIGGELTVESAPGAGTKVQIRLETGKTAP